jgi:hypothetical protein
MSLFLAFLHGEQALVGFIFAAVLALLGVPLLLYVWLWHTRVSELKLAVAYLIITAGACGIVAFNTPDSASILIFTAFFIAFIFSLPWNVITFGVLWLTGNSNVGDREFALVMLLGAGMNTMLVYFAAKKMRGLIQ